MGISLNPQHLKRYKDIALLFIKYGRSDLVKTSGLEEALEADEANALARKAEPKAEELADDLEEMGPTFIKLGQLLSTRADLLQAPYLEALTRLQDKVEPFSFEEIERIIAAELGLRVTKAFSSFDPVPIAAASLGQVHRARLRDGSPVAVKVQRPGIREKIIEDLDALVEVADFLDNHTEMGRRYEFENMLIELRKSLLRELDYRLEAMNLKLFAENLKEFEHLVVPRPVEDYTTSRVLTMDYILGRKITALSPLARLDVRGTELAEELFRAYLKQMLVDGFFHADPHPGNVFLTDDGRIAILDLGMVARLSPMMQEHLLQLLLAISDGRGEEAAERALQIGEPKEEFQPRDFRREVAELVVRNYQLGMEHLNSGKVVLEITRISGNCGFRLPPEFTMMAKALLNLDQVVATLDPKFNPNDSIRRNAAAIMQQRMLKSLSPSNFFNAIIEMKDMLEKMPSRVNKVLDTVANNELKLQVDAIDEKHLMEGIQKIANRITLGLVLAAMIVGAALLMRVETTFQILGYPGLAILFFIAAAGGGIALVFDILAHDEKSNKKS